LEIIEFLIYRYTSPGRPFMKQIWAGTSIESGSNNFEIYEIVTATHYGHPQLK
jgi:hypothetical protein